MNYLLKNACIEHFAKTRERQVHIERNLNIKANDLSRFINDYKEPTKEEKAKISRYLGYDEITALFPEQPVAQTAVTKS